MNKILSIAFLIFCAVENRAQQDLELCQQGRLWGGVSLQYFHVNTRFEGGLREIKRHFFRKYISSDKASDSGYLTIRFTVNCKGKIGQLEVLGCTRDFKQKDFSADATNQLKTILLGMGKWIPGRTTDGVEVDSQKFLTFILLNGELKDIVPK